MSHCIIIPLTMLANANPPASVAEFKDGDSVCFVGDSLTKGGSYHTRSESLYATKFPDCRIRYYNCGVGVNAALGQCAAIVRRLAGQLHEVTASGRGVNLIRKSTNMETIGETR
jgi:hypothetical protein